MRQKIHRWTEQESYNALIDFEEFAGKSPIIADVYVYDQNQYLLQLLYCVKITVTEINQNKHISIDWEEKSISKEECKLHNLQYAYYPNTYNMSFVYGILKINAERLIKIISPKKDSVVIYNSDRMSRIESLVNTSGKILELEKYNASYIDRCTKIMIMQIEQMVDKEKAKAYINQLKEIKYTESEYFEPFDVIFNRAKKDLHTLVENIMLDLE